MKNRSFLKKMNWQDVTMEQVLSHWDGADVESGWALAKYQNAYAYGDIAGNGIDVRCEYADEVVMLWRNVINFSDLSKLLEALGWVLTGEENSVATFKKDNDYAMITRSGADSSYLTMGVTNKQKCDGELSHYFDYSPEDVYVLVFDYMYNDNFNESGQEVHTYKTLERAREAMMNFYSQWLETCGFPEQVQESFEDYACVQQEGRYDENHAYWHIEKTKIIE